MKREADQDAARPRSALDALERRKALSNVRCDPGRPHLRCKSTMNATQNTEALFLAEVPPTRSERFLGSAASTASVESVLRARGDSGISGLSTYAGIHARGT
jgi:hypothetical protein